VITLYVILAVILPIVEIEDCKMKDGYIQGIPILKAEHLLTMLNIDTLVDNGFKIWKSVMDSAQMG